ncbi:cobalamin biosynthesis protein CbiX [Paenibacillus swuensis]|uniref:Cobalamin biosynthesis protein CbiX n=2 Tax=Paenibacillus swuensis TaxID=1178515 RepID=A0A172TNW6_9BACL|nr:cobalamin biosynthesis protein CbiX [Paenibacillus swuensis]
MDKIRPGVLVISHGSRSAEWVRLVDEAVAQMRFGQPAAALGGGPSDEEPRAMPADRDHGHSIIPVESSFLEIVEGRLIQDGIDRLEAQGVTDIIAVPLFVSSGSTHVDEISWSLGVVEEPKLETDLELMRVNARVHWCRPMDDEPEIAAMLWEKVRELSVRPEREILLLVGHGSKEEGFHEQWQQVLSSLAKQLGELGGFAATDTAMLLPEQAAERVKYWQRERPDWDVVVAPFFLSEGYFTETVIPTRLQGLEYRYNGRALLPHPLVAEWLNHRVESALSRLTRTALKT